MPKPKAVTPINRPKSRGSPAENRRRLDLVDELGGIQARLEPLQKRETEIIKEIRALAEAEYKPGQEALFNGQKYTALVTAKPNRRSIPLTSRLKLLVLLGKQRFCELSGFTVEKAEKILTPAQFTEMVEEEANVGTRTVTTILRQQAA